MVFPEVAWAQRADVLYVTIRVPNCKAPQIDLKADSMTFKGVGGESGKETYEVTLKFFKEIVPEECKQLVSARELFFTLKKKESEYWPRLLEDKTKMHWLKVDFDKWHDEDDEEPDKFNAGEFDMEAMMRSMGGMGGMDMGPLGTCCWSCMTSLGTAALTSRERSSSTCGPERSTMSALDGWAKVIKPKPRERGGKLGPPGVLAMKQSTRRP
eukprot:m.167533 g.167533  ORF g.167533 m.167533 type:complete len:212 (-) comp17195_c0_seq1:160-795(-)